VKALKVEGLDPRGPLRTNVAAIVKTRLDELRGFADQALAPDAGQAQHDMRIAAKRLRYVLELFAACLAEESNETRQAAKRLQSVLGDLHDCDLMLPKVEHIPSATTLLRTRRVRLFQEFVEIWDETAIFHA